MIDTGINVYEVKKLRDRLIEGTIIATPYGKCRLLNKYPNIAKTEQGCFKWIEIYLAENGRICEDRKKGTKYEPKEKI